MRVRVGQGNSKQAELWGGVEKAMSGVLLDLLRPLLPSWPCSARQVDPPLLGVAQGNHPGPGVSAQAGAGIQAGAETWGSPVTAGVRPACSAFGRHVGQAVSSRDRGGTWWAPWGFGFRGSGFGVVSAWNRGLAPPVLKG